MLNESCIRDLKRITGPAGIRTGDLALHLDEGFGAGNLAANVLVAPDSVESLSRVVAYCAANNIPMVPQGGRTGLSGAAESCDGQIIIQTSKLNTLVDIDFISGTAEVEAGVTLQQLQEAVSPHGFGSGIDIAARGSATIGGMVSTNAGGTEAFRYGVMRHRVLGLEAVLPDGQVFSDLKQVTKANEGYDIKQLFIGAEGTLGIITRVVLGLVPLHSHRETAMISCDSALAAATVFQRLRQDRNCTLLNAEVMWPNYARTTANQLQLNNLLDFAHSDSDLFVVLDFAGSGGSGLIEELLSGLLGEQVITSALVAQNERERNDFWKIREESFLCDKVYPHGFWYDVSVPLGQLDQYADKLFKRVSRIDPDLKIFLFGHLGDGNLHLTISSGKHCAELKPDIDSAVYDGLKEMGGSFSAEHGIGDQKLDSLEEYCDPVKFSLMKSVKSMLDPKGLMNPGKVVPDK